MCKRVFEEQCELGDGEPCSIAACPSKRIDELDWLEIVNDFVSKCDSRRQIFG